MQSTISNIQVQNTSAPVEVWNNLYVFGSLALDPGSTFQDQGNLHVDTLFMRGSIDGE